MSLRTALGGMALIPQWFLWRLVWDSAEGKYLKTPCALDGSVYRMDAGLRANWNSFDTVVAARDSLPQTPELRYALGFWMTADCGYWFLDIDKCATDGVLTDFAAAMVAAFPGAMMEFSSSKRGVHVFGRCANGVPAHRSRDIHKLHMEFYTQDRGVAFGLDDVAQGSADTNHDAMVSALIEGYFPPRAAGEKDQWDGPRADWRGPDDDDELIRRALQARQGAGSAFGGKASFADLWHGRAEKCSESDMALAAHLAFWTGCDAPRIERLMFKSGLVREKWRDHRTYLRDLTIHNACAGCSTVYQEPVRSVVAQQEMYGVQGPSIEQAAMSGVTFAPTAVISPEVIAKVNELLDRVSACGTVEDMHNDVIPACRAANIPPALAERLVRAINKQLDMWDAKLPVARLRALVCPPIVAGSAGFGEAPAWVLKHCYVKDGDYFFDLETGATMSRQGFQAEYNRVMPIKDNGAREDAAEWSLNRWGMVTVHKVAYRPDQGNYFTWDGLDYANLYNPSSVPEAKPMSEAAIAGVEAFKSLLWDMCARREAIYHQTLCWMAYCVQFPGRKIRWAPIFKGCGGDGKTIIGVWMRACMGWRNVGVTGNATLCNNGGFTDWAVGSAVNIIEEIMLTGKERHRLYNAMKEFINNDVCNVNAKGTKPYKTFNVTNHFATTNHNDAIPLDKTDRRWFVVFTPWETLTEMASYSGLTAAEFQDRFDRIDHAMRNCGGELRTWMLSVPMHPDFNPNGNAMWTPEKAQMLASSRDDVESIAAQVIEDGSYGVTAKALSSSCLTNALKTRALLEGADVPKGMAVNHLLTRLGYSQLDKPVWWEGKTHRVWIKNGVNSDPDAIKTTLDYSKTLKTPTVREL